MAQENNVEVAVLKERIEGLREQNKAQYHSICARIEAIEDRMEVKFSGFETKLDSVITFMNQNKGGLKTLMALMTAAGAVGAGIMKLITLNAALHQARNEACRT